MSQGEYYLATIGRVQEISSVAVVNQALTEGWELLAIREKTRVVPDKHGRSFPLTELVYVLGWSRRDMPRSDPSSRGIRASVREDTSASDTQETRVHEFVPHAPVPLNNGPMGWLKRKLIPSVLRKHPTAKIEVSEEHGLVRSVRVTAPAFELAEIVNDVASSVEWAFETVLAGEVGLRGDQAYSPWETAELKTILGIDYLSITKFNGRSTEGNRWLSLYAVFALVHFFVFVSLPSTPPLGSFSYESLGVFFGLSAIRIGRITWWLWFGPRVAEESGLPFFETESGILKSGLFLALPLKEFGREAKHVAKFGGRELARTALV
jgi:hypothetical protein